MSMVSEEIKWLKRVYPETSVDEDEEGPCTYTKKVKLREGLEKQFSPTTYTPYAVSQIIQQAFPNSESKPCGNSRQKHIFRIQRTIQQRATCSQDTKVLLEIERSKNSTLEHKAKVLELQQSASSAKSTSDIFLRTVS